MTHSNEFFQEIPPEEVIGALPNLRTQEFEKGIVLVRERTAPGSCYYIISGRVQIGRKVTSRNRIKLATVGRGQFFGEMSMLTGYRRSASAVALSRVRLLEIRRQDFARLIRENHPLAAKLALHFSIILAGRASHLLQLLVTQTRHPGKSGKTPPVDMRQVIHQFYSVWAL